MHSTESVQLPFENCFQLPKRLKHSIQIDVKQFEEPIYFSFSTLSGSIQLVVLFLPEEEGICSLNSTLDLGCTSSNFNSSTITLSNNHESIRNGFDLECNYFSSTGRYFCFPTIPSTDHHLLHCGQFSKEGMNSKSMIELIPTTRYPSSKMTIRGKITLPIGGKCFFIFDNSFSFQKSKRILFSLNQFKHYSNGWLYNKKYKLVKKYWMDFDEGKRELRIQKKPNQMMMRSVSKKEIAVKIRGELFQQTLLDAQKLRLVVKLKDGRSIVVGTKRYSELKYWNDIFNSAIKANEMEENRRKTGEGRNNFLSIEEQALVVVREQQDEEEEEEEVYFSNNDTESDDCESFYDIVSSTGQHSAMAKIIDTKRQSLPAQMRQLDIKIMDLIRKPKGAFPVYFNEPLTLLQKLCEDLEYAGSLLSIQSLERNEFESVCAFALSCYASHRFRDRKPFNPILGETFEFQQGNIRYFSEKISHEPLIIATHTIGETFEFWNCFKIQTQLKGISVEVSLQGKNHLKIFATGHLYEWNRANTVIRSNLGQKSIEINGTVAIAETTEKKHSAEIKFKSSSFFSTTPNYGLEGWISEQGTKTAVVGGNWDRDIWLEELKTKSRKEIFKSNIHPLNHKENYGFSEFTMNLNCSGTACKPIEFLPASDSRNRLDLQLYEKGLSDEAQKVKQQLEQGQREKVKEENKHQIKWFELNEQAEWIAKRQTETSELLYWHARDKGKV